MASYLSKLIYKLFAQEAVEKVSEETKNAIDLLDQAFEGLIQELGEEFSEVAEKIDPLKIQFTTELINKLQNKINDLTQELKELRSARGVPYVAGNKFGLWFTGFKGLGELTITHEILDKDGKVIEKYPYNFQLRGTGMHAEPYTPTSDNPFYINGRSGTHKITATVSRDKIYGDKRDWGTAANVALFVNDPTNKLQRLALDFDHGKTTGVLEFVIDEKTQSVVEK